MTPPLVRMDRTGSIATLTFDDPDRRNAMTQSMGEAFAGEIAALGRSESLRAVILSGAGAAFSAGGDLGMLEALAQKGRHEGRVADREIRDTMRRFYELFLCVRELRCPTIAAINGSAIGAGFCVALACDLRIASRSAKLGLNFAQLAIHPGMGATWTLPRLIGTAQAAELLYTGRILSGEEALELGLVNRALPPEDVLPAARAMAEEIAACSPIAVAGTKKALARTHTATLEDQLTWEATEQATCFQTQDIHEGLRAARERRPPQFRGK